MGKFSPPRDERIGDIAQHTLAHFEETAERVREALNQPPPDVGTVFANLNTVNDSAAVTHLTDLATSRVRELRALLAEPAVARIVTQDEEGRQRIYFISRATPHRSPPDGSLAVSYNASPLGRLAALPVGGEVEAKTRDGLRTLVVLERTLLRPREAASQWDSIKSTIEGDGFGPFTIPSFRALLERLGTSSDDLDELDAALAEDRAASLILEGLRRDAIAKMELRDLAILDQYQDEIFRLPINCRLVILGPPGTGKTTTLIKRLGQKLDLPNLSDLEQSLVGTTTAGAARHHGSWIMFTPTALLKQYVKEAFARQNVAAPDQRIQTWDDYRRDLARQHFGILRSGTGGHLVMREDARTLLGHTIADQRRWSEDFDAFQTREFWVDLRAQAESLTQTAVARLAARITAALPTIDEALDPPAIARLMALADPLQELVSASKVKTDKALRSAIAQEFKRDTTFLDELMSFATKLETEDDAEDEEGEGDDEDEPRQMRVGRDAALDLLMRALRAKARAAAAGRSTGRRTKNGRVLDWLGERGPSRDDLKAIGADLLIQSASRRFLHPGRKFVEGIARRYRRFRRDRQAQGVWYAPEGYQAHELHPLEVDVILLAIMRSSIGLLADRRIAGATEDSTYSGLGEMTSLYRTQVLVDEATDFSPIQLACMASLCDPAMRSFVACGDFNQRITEWGSRSSADLSWVFADFDIRSVSITYRHSRQLNELARTIALLSSPDAVEAQLPQRVNNEGYDPVLATSLKSHEDVASWLANRIGEIEQLTENLPPIAVLVSSEAEVKPTADALNRALATSNIQVVACHEGQLAGQDNDVRVFDVRHIKGLEFEAVFFVGLDALEKAQPELFEKYLYVGATRAALFLGLTTGDVGLPTKLKGMERRFAESWPIR